MEKFEAVRPKQLLRSSVVDTIQAAIISGQLEPDVVYSAPKLAAQFGVSATPVREAMMTLDREGLIDTVPNKGFRVRELSAAELDELCQLRILIEVPTVGHIAAGSIAQHRLDNVRALAVRTETSAQAGDLIEHSKIDLEFHTALLALHGNARLVEVVRDLRKRSRLRGLRSHTNHHLLVSAAHEHQEIVDLVEQHDVPRVERLMTKHINDVRRLWAED